MNAACAVRGSFSSQRNGFSPIDPFADVLMAVELRSAHRLGVVAMPDIHMLQADRPLQLIERLRKPGLAHDVIACDMCVAGIDARPCGHEAA